MNCRQSLHLLSAERDASLSSGQRAALDAHLEQCTDCRQQQAALTAVIETLRTNDAQVEVPDAKAAWLQLRADLNTSRRTASAPRRRFRPGWLTVLGLPAALACIALAFILSHTPPDQPSASQVAQLPARAEYLELGDDAAIPVIYVDQQSGWLIVWAEGA